MKDDMFEPTETYYSLIGFYIDPDEEDPQVYTLLMTDDDIPLTSDGYVVFFSKPELALDAIKLYANDVEGKARSFQKVDVYCSVAESLYLINNEDIDSSAIIINFLNVLFDLVKATELDMPDDYKQLLFAFADHLTFKREFSTFFAQQNVSRSRVTDAILWCIGAIVSKSKFLTRTAQGGSTLESSPGTTGYE